MKKTGHQPRLLTAVMEAIANLREGKGSTQKKIVEQVQNHLIAKNAPFRNVMVQIRKAIKHGVDSGLIKQKGGKFKLGLDSKDYAVFKNFQRLDQIGDVPLREHRRRGRRRRGRRRRGRRRRSRRRRRSGSLDEKDTYPSESGSYSESKSVSGTPEPTDRGRRRRGRRGRRRRRRRGRRRAEEKDSSASPRNSEHKEITPKTSEEQAKCQKKGDKDGDRKDRGYDENNEDDPSCGNPECLCSIKQEMDDQYCSRDNFREFDN